MFLQQVYDENFNLQIKKLILTFQNRFNRGDEAAVLIPMDQYNSMKETEYLMSSKEMEKALLRELQEHPFTGTGKPEPLKYQFSGAWSRRINHKDRLVYQVDGEVVTVFVLAMRYHYTR